MALHFRQALRAFSDHSFIGDGRGIGLIGAVELVKDKARRALAGTEARAEGPGLLS